MAALLATRHPLRFRAVVMHSGIPPGTADSGLSALGAMGGRRSTHLAEPTNPGGWPPLLVIHGGGDRVVASSNALAAVRLWSEAAGADATATRTLQRGQRYPMRVTEYRRGARDTVATLVEIAPLGHAWSGGAEGQAHGDARGPDASRLAWTFAARQFARASLA
jgi:hypothetical protein